MSHGLRVDPTYLRARASLLQQTRSFFQERSVLEVMTPLLREYTALDPHIDSFEISLGADTYYLQTSPELAMKILLSEGSGDIYQLTPVFRKEPWVGPHHLREFLMLEWYRLGMDELTLANEVVALLAHLGCQYEVSNLSYREAFIKHFSTDLWTIDFSTLRALCADRFDLASTVCWDDCVELLTDYMLGYYQEEQIVILHGFPQSMSQMARYDEKLEVARRFECYINGVEIANGFHELNNAALQKQRLCDDNEKRKKMGKQVLPIDPVFLNAVDGLPDCSGVALGLDRLLWLLLDQP